MNRRKSESDSSKNDESESPPFSVLINPGNPSLSGVSKFSYFPMGGPEPSKHFQISKDSHPIMGYVSSWGGMEVGKGMFFASNTVDGIVHQYGGNELKLECERALLSLNKMSTRDIISGVINNNGGGGGRLEEGMAIPTKAVGQELLDASRYDILVHTVPPFFNQNYQNQHNNNNNDDDLDLDTNENDRDQHNEFLLAECYRNSLRTASLSSPSSSSSSILKIACPLLGAGCRGFPLEQAINIAAKTTIDWMMMATTTTEAATTDTKSMTNMTDKTSNANNNDNTTAKIQSPALSSLLTRCFGGGDDKLQQQDDKHEHEHELPQSVTLAFGIPDSEIRERLIEAIDQEIERMAIKVSPLPPRRPPHPNSDINASST